MTMKSIPTRINKVTPLHHLQTIKLYRIPSQPLSTAVHPDEFDLCVLGAGCGGIAGAVRGWDYGKKVAVISPLSYLGGATIHNGALSSKVMWQLSRQDRHVRSMYPDHHSSWQSMKNRVQESIDIKSSHYLRQLKGLQQEPDKEAVRYSGDETGGGGDIQLIDGKARFIDKHTVEVLNAHNEPLRRIRSQFFLVSTGSAPRKVIHKGSFYAEADGQYILTSDDILHDDAMSDFPESLLIYGAGVIGCEFATIFSNYGVTKNIILFNEGRDRLLPREDMDVSQFLTDTLQYESKVTVANNVVMKQMDIEYDKQRVKCTFIETESGTESVVYVDKVLLAAGRIPNVSKLNLPGNVCDIDTNGKIKVDDHLRLVGGQNIDCSNIYFCGDALGTWGLVSVAEMEARHGVEYMFGSKVKHEQFFVHSKTSKSLNFELSVAWSPLRIPSLDWNTMISQVSCSCVLRLAVLE